MEAGNGGPGEGRQVRKGCCTELTRTHMRGSRAVPGEQRLRDEAWKRLRGTARALRDQGFEGGEGRGFLAALKDDAIG